MQDTKTPKKAIQGLAWYNLLANPYYTRAFNYITVSVDKREKYIVDDDSNEDNDCEQSDMVSIMINLAYLKQEVAEKFKFHQGFSLMLGREVDMQKSIYDSTVVTPR